MTDAVNHPPHYGGDTTYEAIKVIEAWHLGFCLGNAVKYICRAGEKGSQLEDLRKAAWYVQREIERLEKAPTPETHPTMFLHDPDKLDLGPTCDANRVMGITMHRCDRLAGHEGDHAWVRSGS